MNKRGAGEGKSLTLGGEMGREGVFSGYGWLLNDSLSGDSISFSPILKSVLILCAKGEQFEGEGEDGE